MVNKAKLNLVVFMIINWATLANAECTTSNNDLSIRCEYNGVVVAMEFKICRKTPKISISIDVDSIDLHIKKEAETDIDIPVGSLGSVQYSLKSAGTKGDAFFSMKFIFLGGIPITIFSEKAISDPNCNAVDFWFQSQGIGVLIAIGVAALICIIACIFCCYCCCCRNKTHAPSAIIMQSAPGPFVLPNSNSNV